MEQKLGQLQAKVEADPSIVEKLFAMENPEQVQSFLKDQGLEFTIEEIDILRDALVKTLEKDQTSEDSELSDEDLENVAGGVAVTTAIIVTCGVISGLAKAGGFVHSATRGRW